MEGAARAIMKGEECSLNRCIRGCSDALRDTFFAIHCRGVFAGIYALSIVYSTQ